MQKVALQLEFLIVMNAVKDIGCYLKKLLNEGLIRKFTRVVIDFLDHLVVALEGLTLELLVSVDLVTLGLKNPAESFRIHVVDVALAEFEGIAVVLEHFVVVYL